MWCHANAVQGIFLGQVGRHVHLIRRHVAGRHADRLQRNVGDGVARLLVLGHVDTHPVVERLVLEPVGGQGLRIVFQRLIGRWCEIGRDAFDLFGRKVQFTALCVLELVFDQAGEFLDPRFMHQDLDPRLVHIVTAAQHVVDAKDRFQIGQQVRLGDEIADFLADHGCAAPGRRRPRPRTRPRPHRS